MARITVEDCIDKFPSRFELVLVASNRARKLYSGESATVEIDNDKNTVIALREIAEETLTTEQLKNDLIEEYQTNTFSEDDEINEIEDDSNESESGTDELESDEIHQNNKDTDSSSENSLVNNEQNNSENSSNDEKKQDI